MPDLDWIQTRTAALTVQCPYCPAEAGEPCCTPDGRGGWRELERFPAHTSRIVKGRRP